MRHFPLRELGWAIGFIVLTATAYVGGYFVMVQREIAGLNSVKPIYRVRSELTSKLFAPIHQVDRQLRLKYWSGDDAWEEALREMWDRGDDAALGGP
jgi:hypothetical protein